jgi:hypothetical protein
MAQDALGLPTVRASGDPASLVSPPPRGDTDGFRYKLPDALLSTAAGKRYGLTADNLSFVFIEPTPAIEKSCHKFSNGDASRYGQRLIDSCLYMIGSQHVNLNQAMLDGWYKAIGNTGRKLVETIFLEAFMTISPDVIAEVKASGEAVTC